MLQSTLHTYIMDFGQNQYRVGNQLDPTTPGVYYSKMLIGFGEANKYAKWLHDKFKTQSIKVYDAVNNRKFPSSLAEMLEQIQSDKQRSV